MNNGVQNSWQPPANNSKGDDDANDADDDNVSKEDGDVWAS